MPEIAQEILKKASAGDLPSFEVIYKTMANSVYNIARRIVNNREDAQEVVQEVFLIIHQKLKSFRYESSLKTWIYRITVNYAINFAKKASRAKSQLLDEEHSPAPAMTSQESPTNGNKSGSPSRNDRRTA